MAKWKKQPGLGDRVLIRGKHPHAGKTGTYQRDGLTLLGTFPVVRFDDGSECFVMARLEWVRIAVTRTRGQGVAMPKPFAVMRGNSIYTLRPYRDPWGRRTVFRYVGYCNGEQIGLYRTRKEFQAAIEKLKQ